MATPNSSPFSNSQDKHPNLDKIRFICAGIILCFLLHFVGTAVYTIYFHPLSKFPGPKFAAASRIPTFWALTRGDGVRWIMSLHEKYGDVVRVAPDELSYTNGQAWKDVYGFGLKGKSSLLKRPRFFAKPPNNVDSIIAADAEGHAKARRIFSHAFSDKALKEQEPLFMKYVNLLIRKLKEAVKKDPEHVFNMADMYNFTTFDIMGDLTFGEPLYLLEDSKYTPWVATIFQNMRATTWLRATQYIPSLEKLLKLFMPRSLIEQRKGHFKQSTDRVDRRLALGSSQPDIWGLILRQPEARTLSLDEMHSNASAFMIAGTETTATLLSGLTFQLLKNPESMAKLVHEIRTTFVSEHDITIEALPRLKYLSACLEEGLRIYPPVPTGTPRLVPPEGITVCGEYIPGGTSISVAHYATYQSPANFTLPKSFIPERWLGDPRFKGDNKTAFQPFSYGPRNCLGKNMAYHEMRLILTKVLWNFDLSLMKESDNWSEQNVFTLWEKGPLMAKLTPVRDI